MKFVLKLVCAVVLVAGAYFGYNEFKGKFISGIRLMDTPTVVKEIKKISELTTATFVEEIVINDTIVKDRESSEVDVKGFFSGSGLKKKTTVQDRYHLVQVATTRVRVGFRLDKLEEGDVSIQDNILSLNLPRAEILDAIMNPSDIKPVYDEKWGKWNDNELHSAVTESHKKALDRVKEHTLASDIFDKAEKTGMMKLTAMFKQFGFTDVKVSIKE